MDEKTKQLTELRLIFVITKRGKGDAILKTMQESGIFFNCVFLGKGTAGNELLNLFGLADSEKDIVLSLTTLKKATAILEILKDKYKFGEAGKGFAFTINVNSIGGLKAFKIFSNQPTEESNNG